MLPSSCGQKVNNIAPKQESCACKGQQNENMIMGCKDLVISVIIWLHSGRSNIARSNMSDTDIPEEMWPPQGTGLEHLCPLGLKLSKLNFSQL